MNHKISRKVISCILAVVMLFGISSSALAAGAGNYDKPIVIVNGIANNPLYANPGTAVAQQLFPPSDVSSMALVTEMFTDLIVALASENWDNVSNYFVGSRLYEIFNMIQLNPDGTSMSEGIGPIVYDYSLANYGMDNYGVTNEPITAKIAGNLGAGMSKRVGAKNVYVYTYDWRIDPIESAKGLNDFIQNVKSKSGKDQVSIISEGYGSTVAVSYLAECYEDATADVDNFVTVNSAFEGSSVIGDLFTGRLPQHWNQIQNTSSAFIRYMDDISDNPFVYLAVNITLRVLNKNWEIQDFIGHAITMLGHEVDHLYDSYLRDMLKNFTGLWALVPVEYFDEAMDFMFINDTSYTGDYNSEYQEKLQTFKNYQSSAAEILNKAKSEGINISVISCWDIQIVPIGDNKASEDELFGLSAQSDGLIDTYYSSFGAYTIPLNDVGAAIQNKEQRNKEGECANHHHVNGVYDSLDWGDELSGIAHYIDASTCALPDNTWFIQDMKYGSFEVNGDSMDLIEYLATAKQTTSVFTHGIYRQFLHCNRYVNPIHIGPGPISWPPVDPQYLLGDVNLDGKVTAADARLALRIAARLEDYPAASSVVFKNADVNGDGVINATDARIILRVTAGLATFADYQNTSDSE